MSWKIHIHTVCYAPCLSGVETWWTAMPETHAQIQPILFAFKFLRSTFVVRTCTHPDKRMVKCVINFPTALNIWISNFISGGWKHVLLFKLDFTSCSLAPFSTWNIRVCMLQHVYIFFFICYSSMTNAMYNNCARTIVIFVLSVSFCLNPILVTYTFVLSVCISFLFLKFLQTP